MEKPLKDWTLAEVKNHCLERTKTIREQPDYSIGDECTDCIFGESCGNSPDCWNFLGPKYQWEVLYKCPRCGYFAAGPHDVCPQCGARMEV